jgi:hypothetical protein
MEEFTMGRKILCALVMVIALLGTAGLGVCGKEGEKGTLGGELRRLVDEGYSI